KKDVQAQVKGAFRERVLRPHHVAASPEEDAVFRLLQTASFQTIQPRRRRLLADADASAPSKGHGILFRTLPLTAFRSSPGALDAAAKKVGASENTKLQRLIELLRGMGIGPEGTERVVVFSERIATLEFLREALQKALGLSKDQVELFRGELGDQEQQRLVK